MSKDANPPPNPPPDDIPVGRLVKPTAKAPAKPAPPPATAPEPAKPAKKPVPIGPTIAMPIAAIPLAPPAPAPTSPTTGEYDVELVAIPFPPATKPRLARDQRPLYDMDRRDFLMLGGGVAGTVLAILAAMGLAKALRKKPASE